MVENQLDNEPQRDAAKGSEDQGHGRQLKRLFVLSERRRRLLHHADVGKSSRSKVLHHSRLFPTDLVIMIVRIQQDPLPFQLSYFRLGSVHLRGFGAHEGVEIPGRIADRRGTHLFQRGQDHRIFQGGGKVGVDLGDQVRRHAGGAEKTPPDRGVIAGYAGLRDGWHVGQRLRALGRRHRKRAHRIAVELADHLRQRIDAHRNLAGNDGGEGGGAALVGDRLDLDLGHVVEKLAGEMGRGAVAGHAVG